MHTPPPRSPVSSHRRGLVLTAVAMTVAVTAGCSGGAEPPSPTPVVTSAPPGSTFVPQTFQPDQAGSSVFVPSKFEPTPFVATHFRPVRFEEVRFEEVTVSQGDGMTLYTLPADVLFDFDKADIRPDARDALQDISSSIAQRFPDSPLEVRGHTDAMGSDAYNQDLSERRAASVTSWLTGEGGIRVDRIAAFGFGETEPVAPNAGPDGADDPAGRQRNRRVEVLVTPGQR